MPAESRPGTIGARLGDESDVADDSSDALGGGSGFAGFADGASWLFGDDAPDAVGFDACAVAFDVLLAFGCGCFFL